MNLFILRHGLAVEHGAPGYEDDDSQRPLTSEGKQKLRAIAQGMKALKLYFDLLLSSPYPRASQTAKIVAQSFKAKKRLEFTDDLTPEGSSKQLIKAINSLGPVPGNILLVGHEPYLSEFISLLTCGDSRLGLTLKKGGLCKLATEGLKHGRCATLEWLLTPKQLASLEE